MSECELCSATANIDEHHISYEPEKTILLCRSCHQEVHGAESHPLQPDDRPAKTTIGISEGTKKALQEERRPNESSYDQTIARLLGIGPCSEYVTPEEAREIVNERITARVVSEAQEGL